MTIDPTVANPQENLAPAVPSTQEKVEAQASQQPVPAFSSPVQEANWKKFREEREKERQEKAEAEKRAAAERERARQKEEEIAALKAALENIVSKPSVQEVPEEDQEKIIEKKIADALERERRKNEEENRKREIAELPVKLAQTFNDFNRVVTNENVDYLSFHYPELWAAFKNAPESYETWSSLYKTLKRFIPNLDAKKEAARIEKNLSKPQSMSQPGMSSSGDSAPTLKLEDKYKANWARMQRVLKTGK